MHNTNITEPIEIKCRCKKFSHFSCVFQYLSKKYNKPWYITNIYTVWIKEHTYL